MRKVDMMKNLLGTAAIAVLLCLSALMLGSGRQSAPPVPGADPVYEVTGTWGSFDEIRLFRYFSLEDVPELASVPPYDVEYGGDSWAYVDAGGPVRIAGHDCWEAMYRKEVPK